MFVWKTLLPVIFQCVFSLAPVHPMTSYTQANHDEPTNAVKETTVTSDEEDFRAPGVGDKDLLWDHVGDLTQHIVLGEVPLERNSMAKDNEELNTTVSLVNQIENSVGTTTKDSRYNFNVSKNENLKGDANTVDDKFRQSMVTPYFFLTTENEINATESNHGFNHSEIQGKLMLYPTHRNLENHYSNSAIGNITKNLRKGFKPKSTKFHHRTQHIVYDDSDPFSVIFGEVKTDVRTNSPNNVSKERFENIIGGLAVRRVKELLKKEDHEKTTFVGKEVTTTFKSFAVKNSEKQRDQLYESEKEIQKLRRNNEKFEFGKIKSSPQDKGLFSQFDTDSNLSSKNDNQEQIDASQNDNLFKEWDIVSEEQEKMLEDIVLQGQNHVDGPTRDAIPGRWFILLLAGNSTIVKLRQNDFAKYLKLNLAARLSLEYDEVKVNSVVLAPPRLVVNVSVVPTNEGNSLDLDEEIDLEDKIFGEEEAPLHKLAETNATLLELSGEEYHVVRFLSLRSQQPIQLEDSPSATSVIVNNRHMDIEMVIYVVVGGTCALAILITLLYATYRYFRTTVINWPWKGAKPLFSNPWSIPRHQRMGEESAPSIGGPLTVIYSGSFVDRSTPNSGSWIEEYQPPTIPESTDMQRQMPLYGFGALSNTALPEICDSYSSVSNGSPRFNLDSKLHILGCRPNHCLVPHQPPRTNVDHKTTLDVRIQGVGVDNPNYQS